MAGKRILSLLLLAALASVGCRGFCERWYPCPHPVAAYPVAPAAPACVPCVPCCPPGHSGYTAPAVPPPPPTTAPVSWDGSRGGAACVPCR